MRDSYVCSTAKTTGTKTIEQVAVENVATALAIENARLKGELSAFDRDFFEELEDLKYKYSKLQVLWMGGGEWDDRAIVNVCRKW